MQLFTAELLTSLEGLEFPGITKISFSNNKTINLKSKNINLSLEIGALG